MTDLPPTTTEQQRIDYRQFTHRWRYALIHIEAETWYVQVNKGDVWGVTWDVWHELDNSMGEQGWQPSEASPIPFNDRQEENERGNRWFR